MGLPNIVIEFVKKASASIAIGASGIVGIIIKDNGYSGALVLKDVDGIPTTLTEANAAYIKRAFLGYPKKVIVYSLPADAENLAAAKKYFANNKANYICGTPDITAEQATDLASWAVSTRLNTPMRPVVVVPNVPGDNKAVINFSIVGATANNCIQVDDTNFTEAQYCSRIAGLLAGLDFNVSATFKPLNEVTGIPVVDRDDVDTAIDAGKLTLYNDGDRIVVARGVTSLTTVTEKETADLKKIKIVAIQDQIETDIYSTINKSYIGNYSNSYDNKCLLITAISGYLKKLERNGWLESDTSSVELDLAAQKNYLESIGIDTSGMSEQDIKKANTGSNVYIMGKVSILDAIEDVYITIYKQ